MGGVRFRRSGAWPLHARHETVTVRDTRPRGGPARTRHQPPAVASAVRASGVRRPRSVLAALRDDDGPLRARADGREVVPAGDDLDTQPGILGEGRELVRRDEPQPVVPDPAARRLALAALLVDRAEM